MDDAPSRPQHIVDGRSVVDELPVRIALLPGEVDLVANHLLDALVALLGAERPGIHAPDALEHKDDDLWSCS